MGILTGSDQIEMHFEDTNESQDVLILIDQFKSGNDDAAEKLLKKYNNFLHGNYIKRLINYDFDKGINKEDKEDAYSLLNLIFIEAVNSYDPTRAKFITHLNNRIVQRFREYLMKERLITVDNNRSSKEILEIIEKTKCILQSDILDDIVKSKSQKRVSFRIGDESFEMPLSSFVKVYITDKVDNLLKDKYLSFYKKYLTYIYNDTKELLSLLMKEFDLSINEVHYKIKICNAEILNSLKRIKNLTISE